MLNKNNHVPTNILEYLPSNFLNIQAINILNAMDKVKNIREARNILSGAILYKVDKGINGPYSMNRKNACRK